MYTYSCISLFALLDFRRCSRYSAHSKLFGRCEGLGYDGRRMGSPHWGLGCDRRVFDDEDDIENDEDSVAGLRGIGRMGHLARWSKNSLEWATVSTLVLVMTVRPCTIYALTEWVCTDWVFCTEHFGMKTDAKIFENDDILGRRHGLGGWGDRLDFRTKKTNGWTNPNAVYVFFAAKIAVFLLVEERGPAPPVVRIVTKTCSLGCMRNLPPLPYGLPALFGLPSGTCVPSCLPPRSLLNFLLSYFNGWLVMIHEVIHAHLKNIWHFPPLLTIAIVLKGILSLERFPWCI